jgi:hypothetical protein
MRIESQQVCFFNPQSAIEHSAPPELETSFHRSGYKHLAPPELGLSYIELTLVNERSISC